jgi:hypothetical protein
MKMPRLLLLFQGWHYFAHQHGKMDEDAGRSTTEFLTVRDGSTCRLAVCWLPVCWLPVCWLPVCWLAVCRLDVLTVRDILIRLNKDDGLLLRLDAAEAAPSEYTKKKAENQAEVPFPPLGTG